jgi:glycine/D-amino acid oxidase-like deaminating enzyme
MRGVDLIQNCEVTGMRIENGRIKGVETSARLHRREEGRRRGGGLVLAR